MLCLVFTSSLHSRNRLTQSCQHPVGWGWNRIEGMDSSHQRRNLEFLNRGKLVKLCSRILVTHHTVYVATCVFQQKVLEACHKSVCLQPRHTCVCCCVGWWQWPRRRPWCLGRQGWWRLHPIRLRWRRLHGGVSAQTNRRLWPVYRRRRPSAVLDEHARVSQAVIGD